jgi:cell division protein FtsW (lipid II flippase)
MSPQSRLVAGIVLIIVPTVEIGGASILSLLIADPAYAQNDLRQDLWWVVRVAFPIAAVLMALGFFMSVLSPEATEPNAMIYLAYVAGLLLAVGLLVLGVGLIRGRRTASEPA